MLSGQAGVLDEMFHIPHPPNAPILSLLTAMAGAGKMIIDPSIPAKGQVTRVAFKEYNLIMRSASPPSPLLRDLVMEFDEQGREIAEIENRGSSQSRTTTTYQNGRIATRESSTKRDGKPLGSTMSDRWTYDAAGHLVEFRRVQGTQSQNHYMNLKYDARGRPIGSEYHQGPQDAMQSRVEYQYSQDGKSVTSIEYSESGERLRSTIRSLDEKGQVIGVEFEERDWKTHKWKEPQHLKLTYDGRGRMIEQDGEAVVGELQDEQSIPPGKVRILYDDAQSTREISLEDGGKRIVSTARLDKDGAILALSVSGVGDYYALQMEFECVYDARGNWTECKRWATKGNERTLSGQWQRTITYR